MTEINQDGLDATIVVRDSESALKFYRDTIGLEHFADIQLPAGVMHRLKVGVSILKLICPQNPSEVSNPGGGLFAATGIRTLTIPVPNVDEMLTSCGEAGFKVTMPRTETRPGVVIGFVEDADGNPIEFLEVP